VTLPLLPGAPQLLEINLVSARAVLTWESPEDDGGSEITGFNVYRRMEGEQDFVHAGLVDGRSRIFVDQWAEEGNVYEYYLTSSNIMGEGMESEIVLISIEVQEEDESSSLAAIDIMLFVSVIVLLVLFLTAVFMRTRRPGGDDAYYQWEE
jgi:hypothetical protein